MRRFFLFILVVQAWSMVLSQSPEAMSFQAVIRDANSVLVQNMQVGVRMSVLQGSVNGVAIFIERHTPTTNYNGLTTLEIGNGAPVTGSFSSIDWSNGPYFLKIETDLTGGTNYSISGTSQLLSVPYALHAATAGSVNETDPLFGSSIAAGISGADTANWNNDLVDDADADPGNEIQTLSYSSDTLSISNGNFVLLPQDQDWTKSGSAVYNMSDSIGIGTSSPTVDLEIAGAMKYIDGNQGYNKILHSDSTGLAFWDTLPQPFTFHFKRNGSWTATSSGNIPEAYIVDTLVLSTRSIVQIYATGVLTVNGWDIAASIVFPGENETFTTTGANVTSVFWSLRDYSYYQFVNNPNRGGAIATSRWIILNPGAHEVRLMFGGINNGPTAQTQLHGGSIKGLVIPLN